LQGGPQAIPGFGRYSEILEASVHVFLFAPAFAYVNVLSRAMSLSRRGRSGTTNNLTFPCWSGSSVPAPPPEPACARTPNPRSVTARQRKRSRAGAVVWHLPMSGLARPHPTCAAVGNTTNTWQGALDHAHLTGADVTQLASTDAVAPDANPLPRSGMAQEGEAGPSVAGLLVQIQLRPPSDRPDTSCLLPQAKASCEIRNPAPGLPF